MTSHDSPREAPPAAPRTALLTALGVALTAVGCAPPGPVVREADTLVWRHSLSSAETAGAPVSYLRNGPADARPLILVHGTPGSAAGWADYLADPPPGALVLALDRPGFGHSGPSGAVPSLAAQAAAVVALIDRVSRGHGGGAVGARASAAPAPVVLLGHSLGAPIVARVAADAPDRVAAVVLLAGSLDPSLEIIHPLQRLAARWPVSALLPRVLRNANTELMGLRDELTVLAEQLPRIRAKVVIMHGTQDDLVPVANVAFMRSRLTGARCLHTVLLEGRNHFLPWNSPADVRRAMALAMDPAC